MANINVLNNTENKGGETREEQKRINVSNIPPKSIGQRELSDFEVTRYIPMTEPSAPTEGMLYYDSTANKLKIYTGSAWETITSS